MLKWRLALLGALIIGGPAAPARNATPPETAVAARDTIEIPLINDGGALWVDVRINDRVTARMMIDTGASVVILPPRVAAALDLEGQGEPQELKTLKGSVMGRWVTLDRIGLGNAKVDKVAAVMLEGRDDRAVGLLGRSFLNHFSYSVDLDRGLLILSPRNSKTPVAWRSDRAGDMTERQLEVLRAELDRASRDGNARPEYLARVQRSIAEYEARLQTLRRSD